MDCFLAVLKGTLFSILDCFSCSLSSLWQNQGIQSCTRSIGGHWDKRVDLRCEDKLCFQRQFRGELKQQEAIYQHIVYYRLWAKNFKSWMDLFLASNLGQGPGANKMKTIISLQHNDKLHIIHCFWYVSWLQRPAILNGGGNYTNICISLQFCEKGYCFSCWWRKRVRITPEPEFAW